MFRSKAANRVINTLRVYHEALKGFRGKAAVLIFALAMSGLLEGAALTALMPLLNEHLKSLNVSSFELFKHAYQIRNPNVLIFGIVGIFCVLGLLSAVAKLVVEWQTLRLRVALERDYNNRLVDAIAHVSWTAFSSVRFGDVVNALTMESRNIASGAAAVITMLGLILIAFFFLVLGYALSPHMTLLTFGFGVLMWVVSRIVSVYVTNSSDRLSAGAGKVADETQQLLGNLKFMRSTGLSASIVRRMSAAFQAYEAIFFSSHVHNPIMRFIFEIVGIVFVSAIIAVSAWTAPGSLGRILIFLAVFYRLAPRVANIQEQYGIASNYRSWYEGWRKLHAFMAQHADAPSISRDLTIPAAFQSVSVQRIRVDYDRRAVLNGVEWSLTRGRCLAFVGESGSGKTTMVDLVTGVLKPTDGQLQLNDTPFARLDLHAWQARIGLVMQNAPIFHATIFENIAWGDPAPNAEEAEKVARLAHAWEFIEKLPKGLDTLMGDKGAQFSVGECQRVALARALYREPWLLILDEATSALDAKSETIINDTLRQLKGSTTLLMVVHRLQAAQWADEILVFDQGTIVERGTYETLMRRPDGVFHRLAQLQGLSPVSSQ